MQNIISKRVLTPTLFYSIISINLSKKVTNFNIYQISKKYRVLILLKTPILIKTKSRVNIF